MRAAIVALGIGALVWMTVGREDAPEPALEHTAAVSVHVSSGPTVGTARTRQLQGALD